jgi:peptidoglycan/xylan/chitin deacetylase (PgdA/CDA1 family)
MAMSSRVPRPILTMAIVALVALVALFPAPGVVSATGKARFVTHGDRSRPTIALTFDDGWGTANCRKIVNILQDTGTPATFLPNAKWVRRAPAFWARVARLGYPLANHTTHHTNLTHLSYAGQFKEINSDRRIIESITRVPMTRVLRPPFGAFNTTTLRAAAAAGFPTVMNWDTTFADTSRRRDGTLWPLSAYVRAATQGRSGSIILGHCGSPVDHQILRKVIARYRDRGLRFVTIAKLLRVPSA